MSMIKRVEIVGEEVLIWKAGCWWIGRVGSAPKPGGTVQEVCWVERDSSVICWVGEEDALTTLPDAVAVLDAQRVGRPA